MIQGDRYNRDRLRYDRSRSRYGRDRYGKSRGKYYDRRKTKKELRKKKKTKKKKITIDSIPKASEFAQKRCNACIKLKSLLKKPFISEKRKGNKFIKELEKAEKKCLECNEICKYLNENLNQDMEDFDIYKARYPSICLIDEKGSKRVFRLMNSYRKKLLEQIEHFDLNVEKE